jgi:hypothetical protein
MGDINITKWTPELIPAELPPNVEPELHEPHYKKGGQVVRTTAHRKHEAVCLDPSCPLAFQGPTAFPEATAHTANTGHLTRLYYVAEYTMAINPLHPKNYGKVRVILDPTAPDLPPSQQPVLGQGPTGKRPRTNAQITAQAIRQAERQQKAQELADVVNINEQHEQQTQQLD